MNEVFSTTEGLETVCTLLVYMGAMCPLCAHGTRVTSKRWAKCKKCGNRVERRKLPEFPHNTKSEQP